MKALKLVNVKTGNEKIIGNIDVKKLHTFIIKNISNELSGLVTDCYYPKFNVIYKDLLHMTNSNEKDLLQYSKVRYGDMKFNLLHDPKTTLILLIIQEFLKNNDIAAAMSAFHLFSLRTYSNIMHKYIKYCNPEYFATALSNLSKNHIFVSKKTIASSIMYQSNELFKKYQNSLSNDDVPNIVKLIMEIRNRFNQSIKAFAHQYYLAHKSGGKQKHSEEKDYEVSHDRNLQEIVSKITTDITTYKNIDNNAINESQKLTKFNKNLAEKYIKELCNTKYSDLVNDSIYLLIKDISNLGEINTLNFINHVKKLMSIKVSNQPVYFKKTVNELHNSMINNLNMSEWFKGLSIQTQAISRNFVAYYLALYVKNFIS